MHDQLFNARHLALHVLTITSAPAGAWNIVHLRGQAYVLVPCLVTGLKIWHMRRAGIFYPKHSFLTTMANLPDSTQVLNMGSFNCSMLCWLHSIYAWKSDVLTAVPLDVFLLSASVLVSAMFLFHPH